MKKEALIILGTCIFILISATVVLAASITINGAFADWTNTSNQPLPVFHKDGAADDYGSDTSTARNDITQFGLAIDPAQTPYFFLLYAWDDTDWPSNNSYYSAVTLKSPGGTYYRIMTYLGTNLLNSDINRTSIYNCGNGASPVCPASPTCTGAACTCSTYSLVQNSSSTWADPFSGTTGHNSNQCQSNKPDCTVFDTAVELRVPWCAVGGAPVSPNQYVFTSFASYSSTGTLLDGSGSNGIACRVDQAGALYCYNSTPTNVTVADFSGASQTVPPLAWGGLGLAALGLAFYGGKRYLKRRA